MLPVEYPATRRNRPVGSIAWCTPLVLAVDARLSNVNRPVRGWMEKAEMYFSA
jgi:hypothetical protein